MGCSKSNEDFSLYEKGIKISNSNNLNDVNYLNKNGKSKIEPNSINMITMTLLIQKDQNDKDDFLDNYIHFLDNKTELFGGRNNYNNLKELNTSNVELYINGKKQRFKKYYKFPNTGLYKIKLKFNISMTNCSYMFYNSIYLTDIDLTSFDTSNVTNMAFMFAG